MRFRWGAFTDAGMVRPQNEDSFSADDTLFVVADGMGGHNAGEVASALAVATVKAGAKSGVSSASHFRELVQQANTAIYTASLDDSTQRGMGTTLTSLAVLPGEEPLVLIANVGDSRAYLWRDAQLSTLSVDHSYVQELVNEGIISAEEARVHPRRNIVTRALGIDRNVVVDVFECRVRKGDRFILCSDGLVDEVSDQEIARVLATHSDPQETSEALVMVANANGGRDNTTVVIVDVLDDTSEPTARTVPDDTAPIVAVDTALARTPARRVNLFGVAIWAAVVAVLLSAITVIGVYARSGYFIGFDTDDRVTIYRGRVGGVLWFGPTVDTQTQLTGDQLPEDILRDVALNKTFSSSSMALKYLSLVELAIIDATTSTIAGSDTSTTSVPASSTSTTVG